MSLMIANGPRIPHALSKQPMIGISVESKRRRSQDGACVDLVQKLQAQGIKGKFFRRTKRKQHFFFAERKELGENPRRDEFSSGGSEIASLIGDC
ncbi:hypothetical protein U1Q18_025345 [Sarracenia purpurea var. burkii]